MVTLREAAQQALKALESCSGVPHWPALRPTINDLRQALEAEQQTEPVAWINWCAATGQRSLGWQCESELASEPLYHAPQPAQQPVIPKSETCKCCGEGQADLAVLRICDKCGSEYAGQAEFDLAMRLRAEQQDEPFGYFKAEPFGWTDCAETDEGAVALYERPNQPAQQPLTDEQIDAMWQQSCREHFSGLQREIHLARAIERAHGIK